MNTAVLEKNVTETGFFTRERKKVLRANWKKAYANRKDMLLHPTHFVVLNLLRMLPGKRGFTSCFNPNKLTHQHNGDGWFNWKLACGNAARVRAEVFPFFLTTEEVVWLKAEADKALK